MNLLHLIKTRRTIRNYQNIKIKQTIIENILEAGRWAPSAHNLQPWKFVVVEGEEKINKIADIMEEKANELFSGFNIVMRDTAKNVRKSQLLIFAYNSREITKKFKKLGSPYSKICEIYEVQSVSNAIENMLLYIYDLGLGAAWCGMILFCEKEINNFLKQESGLLALLSVGYPGKYKTLSRRKEIFEITEFII